MTKTRPRVIILAFLTSCNRNARSGDNYEGDLCPRELKLDLCTRNAAGTNVVSR